MKLSKEERTVIVRKIGDIIEDHCRECPFNDSGMRKGNKVCVKCTHYKELRKLGEKLEGRDLTKTGSHSKEFDLTAEKYYWFKEKRFTDRDIAEYYKISLTKLNIWKTKNGIFRNKMKERIS